jgi:hypothetical protein
VNEWKLHLFLYTAHFYKIKIDVKNFLCIFVYVCNALANVGTVTMRYDVSKSL